jgi:hypothetical protein
MRGRSQSSSIPTRRFKRRRTAVAETGTVRRALAELVRRENSAGWNAHRRIGLPRMLFAN